MKALLSSQDAWEVVEEVFEELKDTTGYTAAQNKVLKEAALTNMMGQMPLPRLT